MKKNEYGDLKRMLLDEYMQSNPTDDEVDAFYTGLTWFEDALYDDDIDNELNDFLPLRKENEYLRKDLAGLHKILEENIFITEEELEFKDYPGKDSEYSYSIEMFQEFYDLNRIDPITLIPLEIKITNPAKDILTNKGILTEDTNNTENFTLNNNITIKF